MCLCLWGRYIKAYHESGILNSTVGFNLQQECKKISGLSKTMYQVWVVLLQICSILSILQMIKDD